jgi:hypothetical protein
MRRTRSLWQNALFLVPVFFVTAGIFYLSKNHTGVWPKAWQKALVRSPASSDSPESVQQLHAAQTSAKQKLKQQIAKMNEDEDTPTEDLALTPKAPAEKGEETAQVSPPSDSKGAAAFCTAEEFPGKGPDAAHISQKDWESVMEQFHFAKASLSSWLKNHKKQFSEKTYQWMNAQIADARLQRPPSEDEPDVAWRGILVPGVEKSEAGQSTPVIRVGGGFVKLIAAQPARARFELSRILAQSWAPCSIHQVDPTSPWKDFLTCMNMEGEADAAKACVHHSYSEAGWAVSSAIAAVAAPPGCRVPAFAGETTSACMKKMEAL